MNFTTVKKRVEKEELFPNDAVMTLLTKQSGDAAGNTKFSLNRKAMELFGFPVFMANTSRIANGFDDNNKVILATMDTNDMYTNNVTAKNDFSSQLLSTRLAKQFKLAEYENHFMLNLIEESVGVKFIGVALINAVNVPEEKVGSEKPLDFCPSIEPNEEELTAIETAHANEIAQQEEDIINSQSSCAETLPEPPVEVIIKAEPVLSV